MKNFEITEQQIDNVISLLQEELNSLAYIIDNAPLTEVVPYVKQRRMLQSCLADLIETKRRQGEFTRKQLVEDIYNTPESDFDRMM